MEDPERRNSGTFTNPNPAYLKRTRPHSEIITANVHPAENSYAIRSTLRNRGGLNKEQYQTDTGALIKNSMRSLRQKNLMLLKEDSLKSSSDESLNNPVCNIPRVVVNGDDDQFEQFNEEDLSDSRTLKKNSRENITVVQPTFSFTDFDEIRPSEIRSACQHLQKFEELGKIHTCHREQSVDSSNQSCDSDCSYPGCTEKNDTASHYSYSEEPTLELTGKIDFDVSKQQNICRSFQIIDESCDSSIDQFNSIEICRLEDCDEIPYIDDIDSEPLIFEHKSCSKENVCQDGDQEPSSRGLFSDSVPPYYPLEKKKSCDVGINVQFDSLTLEDEKVNGVNGNLLLNKETKIEKDSQTDNEFVPSDFLGQSPKDQNFFSESLSNLKNNNQNSSVHYINVNIDKNDSKESLECNNNFSNTKSGAVITEYNVLESSDDSSPENIIKNSSSFEKLKKHKSDYNSRSYSRNGVNFYSTYTDSESSSSEIINKGCNLMVIGKSISKSGDSIADQTENRCWNSPDDVRLGCGKVKALTKLFDSMNLVYRSKSFQRNCQSSPNLCQDIKYEKCVLSPVIASASLANISKNFSIASDQNNVDNTYSEQEKENILIQLEDWSKYGTKGSIDSLTIATNNLVNGLKNTEQNNSSKSNLIFQEIVECKPRKIILRNVKINMFNKTPNSHRGDSECHLEKKFGSLEKLTGSLVPRVIEMIPRKTFSTPDDVGKERERALKRPAIEKTKLVLPKKKFPHSYIVRKKSTSVDTRDSVLDSDLQTQNIIQSCPNLSKNYQIRRNHNLIGQNFHHSCPSLIGPSHVRLCRIKNSGGEVKDRPPTPRYTVAQTMPLKIARKKIQSYGDFSLRRMSERDLPSKLEQEQNSAGGHIPTGTVKSSKSVPALHEHTKQHEVFNPGYSRTSSNNSIPAMPGLKGKPPHHQADQNSFYQNLSVYRNTGLGDRSSALRNSQNALQLQGQPQQMKTNAIPEGQSSQSQTGSDRLSLSGANQRPQSAYYGNQSAHSPSQTTNGMRTAQSTKDLAYASESQGNHQVRGGYPSMPNVNEAYGTHGPNQQYSQMQGAYSTNQLQSNTYTRPPMSPMNPNQYGSQALGNGQYGNQTQFANQGQGPNQYHSQNLGNNQYSNQQQVSGGTLNQYGSHIAGSSPNLRGQAKLAEMSEEVTRMQQRGPLSPHGNPRLMSPMQQNSRFQYGSDVYNNNNGPMSPNTPMTPTKPQPPVAPKPQGMKRGVSGETISQDIIEGPPLPPTATHPLYHHANDEDGNYMTNPAEASAASYYGTQQRGGQAQQNSGQSNPPNPWEREEREKELEARRSAARVWRDKQISALQGIGEDRRTPQQEQQLRALTLDRDFQRRAQQAQSEEEDKETERPPVVPPHGGLLRVATNNNGNSINNNTSQSGQGVNSVQDLNLVPVASNIVSSIQPVCVASSNTNGSEQTQDPPPQQQHESRNSNQLPPPPPVQPKSILKSNLRLDNLNSNSPQSPSKTHKNASFSANLTPQSLKFDNNPKSDQKYDNNSKYDHNVNNKYDTNASSKFDNSQPKYPEQMNPISGKYEQHLSYNINTALSGQNSSKFDPNHSVTATLSPSTLLQDMSNLNMNTNLSYNRLDNRLDNVDTGVRLSYDNQIYNQQSPGYIAAPSPPERGSSFAIMSQQQALRSNVSTSSQMSLINQNSNLTANQTINMKDKRVSFHDNDQQNMSIAAASIDSRELEMEPIREDPDRFITEAEMMLQSPTSPTGTNVTHTPGVIGAQEVYRDPRQRRLAEQQRAQQAGSQPIPEKLSFKEKMKMFALESGESNTPKDKVKISRAQRDIDAVH